MTMRDQNLQLADAILAALPGMIPDLVWKVSHHSNGQLAGDYYICLNPGHATKPLRLNFLGEFVDYSANLEAAKAAANAHQRAAIAQAAGWTKACAAAIRECYCGECKPHLFAPSLSEVTP
jgi:hypothetical protein